MLAVSSLNTISSLISKLLSDDSITDEEYSLILSEFETFTRVRTFPQFPSITAYDDDGEEENVFIGDIAEQYLRKFASMSGTDKTVGLRDKDCKFYIGNKDAKIKENNIIVGDKEYACTPGLWEIIPATFHDDKIVTNGIMIIMLK